VREDALQLYGFSDEVERNLFERLISVSGIGRGSRSGILSGATASRVAGHRVWGRGLPRHAPGVGKKLASRLVVDWREKFTPGDRETSGSGNARALQVGIGGTRRPALVSLGFHAGGRLGCPGGASGMGANATVETVIRKALQQGVR